jgi:hypothetical protein
MLAAEGKTEKLIGPFDKLIGVLNSVQNNTVLSANNLQKLAQTLGIPEEKTEAFI